MWSSSSALRSQMLRTRFAYSKTAHQVRALSTIGEESGIPNPIFNQRVSFSDIIDDNSLRNELTSKGFKIATDIQVKAFSQISRGKDVVIGAETGSGKTLSYILPLLSRYALSDTNNKKTRGLILAPTNDLCNQIFTMSAHLFNSVSTAEMKVTLDRDPSSFMDWLHAEDKLHVTLCTPKNIADAVRGSDHFSPEHPFRALDFLVLDEADMLLEGSYQRDVEIILEQLRLVRRNMIREGALPVNAHTVQYVLAAATIPTYGRKSVHNFIKHTFPHALEVRTENLHQHHPAIDQKFIQLADEDYLTERHVQAIMDPLLQMSKNTHKSESGAPPNWISLEEYSTMVFMNTAASTQELARLIRGAGHICAEYHSLVPKEQRKLNLESFRNEEVKLLICTDACARGLDIPHVRRVVQGEFALNVVQHLHRIGRASRGGRQGAAINLYTSPSVPLVNSITNTLPASSNEEESDGKNSIEKSFSRRRGFRNQLKRAAQLNV